MGKKSGIGAKKEVTTLDPMDLMDSLFSISALNLFDCDNSLITTKATGDDGEERPEALFYKDHRPSKRELKTVASNQYLHQVLTGLPSPGETWHCISNSRFNFFSFIPSVIKYLGDYTTILYCATWTTNNINTKELIQILDDGKIGAITFVVGNYFKVREAPVYNYLATKLMERKQLLVSGEHHLKVLLSQFERKTLDLKSIVST